ncbi:hypothetical protein ACFFHI_02915 [Streptomyces palmae]|uniref:hypothetical protein n=1 Tax=Streptomyces palmae TaxID=1701085 RepID=UPI0035E869EA
MTITTVRAVRGAGGGKACAAWCGIGSAELALVGKVLGACVRLRVTLSGHCPGRGGN